MFIPATIADTTPASIHKTTASGSIYDGYLSELQSVRTGQYIPVRVLLSTPNQYGTDIRSPQKMLLAIGNGKTVRTDSVKVRMKNGNVYVAFGNFKLKVDGKVKILPTVPGQYLEISDWNRIPAWSKDGKINDNKFLGALEVFADGDRLAVVNELDFEDYMRGIAEVPELDQNEKRKALAVVARSYVYHYISTKYRKFAGKDYDASDDPTVFQKYLGYGFTLRSPKWQQAISDTKDEIVIRSNGEALRTAYFSCTLGDRTLNPSEAKFDPAYFVDVAGDNYKSVSDVIGKDPLRTTKPACGHQVGLSGYGATKRAESGQDYKAILSAYYSNVIIGKVPRIIASK